MGLSAELIQHKNLQNLFEINMDLIDFLKIFFRTGCGFSFKYTFNKPKKLRNITLA